MLAFIQYNKEKNLILEELSNGNIFDASAKFNKFNSDLNYELRNLAFQSKKDKYVKLNEFYKNLQKEAIQTILDRVIRNKRSYLKTHQENITKERIISEFNSFYLQSSVIVDINDVIQYKDLDVLTCNEINYILDMLDKKLIEYNNPLDYSIIGKKFLNEANVHEYIDYIFNLESVISKFGRSYDNFSLCNTYVNDLAKKVVNEAVEQINLFEMAYYKISSKIQDEKISISEFTTMILEKIQDVTALLKFLEINNHLLYDKNVIKTYIQNHNISNSDMISFLRYLDFEKNEIKDLTTKVINNENIYDCINITKYVDDAILLQKLQEIVLHNCQNNDFHNYVLFLNNIREKKVFYTSCNLENLIKNICKADGYYVRDVIQNVPKENKEKIIEYTLRYGDDRACFEVSKFYGGLVEIENKIIKEKMVKACVAYVKNIEKIQKFNELKNVIVYNASMEDLMDFCENYYNVLDCNEKSFVETKVATSCNIDIICDYLLFNKNVDKRTLISPCLNAMKYKECIKFLQRVKLNDADFNYIVTGLKFITPKDKRKSVFEEIDKINQNRRNENICVKRV